MSNLMVTLLVVFAFAAGLGLGLVLVIRPRRVDQREQQRRDASTIYFGRDDDEDNHPHDIERQGSLFPPRDIEHRYDGMTDGDAPHVPVGARGLDFGSAPR